MAFKRIAFGMAIGYVLGTRAGPERYEQLVERWRRFCQTPVVADVLQRGTRLAGEARQRATEALEARRGEGRDEGSRRAKDDGPGDRERTGNMLTTIRERGRVD